MTETTQDGMTTHQLRLCLAVMCKLPMSDPRHSNTLLQALLAVERLIHIERQILYRDESMPEWAVAWVKDGDGTCAWLRLGEDFNIHRPGKATLIRCYAGGRHNHHPDYRPDEDGPITLAIIEPEEG